MNIELASHGASVTGDAPITVTFTSGNVYTIDNSGKIEKYTPPKKITVAQAKSEGTEFNSNTKLIDDFGNEIMVPMGFKIASGENGSGTNIKEGIVVEDNEQNQYVWIPIGEGLKISTNETVDINLGRYSFESGGTINDDLFTVEPQTQLKTSTSSSFYYIEGLKDSTTVNSHAKDIEMFINSANTNLGFYIARYEASYRGNGKVGSKVSTGTIPTSKPSSRTEGQLWNFITQSEAFNACQGLYDDIINSDLINSYAWDTAILYIQAMGNNNYAGSNNGISGNTGTTGDEVCKIFDMSSNCREWTTETMPVSISSYSYYDNCVLRGGQTNGRVSTYSTDSRSDDGEKSRTGNWSSKSRQQTITFRSMLYF